MIPAVIEGHERVIGAPQNWDEAQSGKCLGLPVRTVQSGGMAWMQSAWRPSPEEIEAIQRGACVILSISAPVHPVVGMTVGSVPGQGEDTGLTYAKGGVTPNGEKMQVWNEDKGCPVVRPVHEVNTREGWVKVWREDAMGHPMHDDQGNPILDTLRGRFSIRWR